MDPKNRENVRVGLEVSIVEKYNQSSGDLTKGMVEDILTNSSYHPHGIKVRLSTGEVGRVQIIH
ncbi:MAG: YwbE family protein [Patescibacteria group bacterium]